MPEADPIAETSVREDDPDFVAQLEALFGAVLDKARGDPAFAKRIATAVVDPAKFSERARYATDWASEAPDLNPEQIVKEYGADELRRSLRALKRRQIYALVRAHNLRPARTSAMNKTQLIEHVVRTAEGETAPVKSIFDY